MPGKPPPLSKAEGLKAKHAEAIRKHAEAIERVAKLEGRSSEDIIIELDAFPVSQWQRELERRIDACGGTKWRARTVISRGIFPRGPDFGLIEVNVTAGIDGYQWMNPEPGPLSAEAKVGVRELLLPIADTNVGIYFSTEFAIPLQSVGQFVDQLTAEQQAGRVLTSTDLNRGRLLSNRLDLSGGLQVRILAFGSAALWRGLFGTIGYRGSVWGGQDHGFEAGFGFEIWKIRVGGTWFRPMAGPLKDQGGQMWGVKLEWRVLKAFERAGL
jgi:hypothetical protein